MINFTFLLGILVCLSSTFVRGTFHHPRVVMLAVAGLTGMYMIHLLADDYNTYQSYNRPSGKFLGKRSTPEEIFGIKSNATTTSPKEFEPARKTLFTNHIAKLDMVLRFDPTECARKYVCTMATKSSKKLKKSEKNILYMIRSIANKEKTAGGTAFRSAMQLGLKTKDPEACSTEYARCIFTASQMLTLLSWL